jgi:uncharacterized protein (DUF2147 family)
MLKHIFAAGTALCLSAVTASANDPAFGLWLVENERAIVEIGACEDDNAKACGKIVWFVRPNNSTEKPILDFKNNDESLRSRPLCGLPIIGNFVQASDGTWEDGFIYDPTNGDLYDSFLESQSDGSLKVRGYIGVSLFGKSQIWTRVSDNRGGC